MEIIIKKVVGNVVQVTTLDERFYAEYDNKDNYKGFRPSLTWITSYYPKGKEYEQWLGGHGYDEAKLLMKEAGERGSRVHKAIEELVKRFMEGDKKGIKMLDTFGDMGGEKKDLDPSEWRAVMTFIDWFKQKNIIKILSSEQTLLTKYYGCTLDFRYTYDKKGEEVYAVTDFKTSKYIYPSSEIQLTGQKRACEENDLRVDETSILQVGYALNKKGWKEKVYDYQPELLDSVYNIWKKENANKRPYQREYPISLSLF